MACQSADLIAGIAALAGMTFLNPSNCAPSESVNILHIHGTADHRGSATNGLVWNCMATKPGSSENDLKLAVVQTDAINSDVRKF